MANKIGRVPVREQDPQVRVTNFEEVCYGYSLEEAQLEASRCLHCRKPRCVDHCPVSVQIPQFIAELAAGDLAAAAAVIAQDSSLPSVCGRVCPQESQCEGACILGIKGEPVAIGKMERFVGDWALEHADEMQAADRTAPNGHKVAVIGSGPAGLACASDLAKMGYQVTIFEALHKPGGVLEYGIPEFRLPKSRVVAREIDNVRKLGVKIETDVIVGRTVTIDELLDREGYEAVFVGSGAGLPRFMNIPGENLNGVQSANEFLTRVNLMKPTMTVTIRPFMWVSASWWSAAATWRWMPCVPQRVWVPSPVSFTAAAKPNCRPVSKRCITPSRRELSSACCRIRSKFSVMRRVGSARSGASVWNSANPMLRDAVRRWKFRVPNSNCRAMWLSWRWALRRIR